MKKDSSGDFSVLYVEAGDERASLFQLIAEQQKPVVIMLVEQSHVLQRPDDFASLKHVKRQLNLPIVFVIPQGGHLAQLAARNGFPVYLSMDALADALQVGQAIRTRPLNRSTSPLANGAEPRRTTPLAPSGPAAASNAMAMEAMKQGAVVKKTVPLALSEEEVLRSRTAPLESSRSIPFALPPSFPPSSAQSHAAPLGAGHAVLSAPTVPRSAPPMSATLPPALAPQPSTAYFAASPQAASQAEQVWNAPLTAAQSVVPPRTLPLTSAQPVVPPRLQPQVQSYREQPPLLQPLPPKERRRFPLLLVLLTIALLIGIVGSFLVFPRIFPETAPAAPPVLAGHLAFTSSEQLSENSSQGIEDQATLDLSNLPDPAAHKSFYAWLLGDKNLAAMKSTLLGTLQINKGNAHLFYGGDAQHDNLLLTMSRVLVTEEDAAVTPIAPSPDQSVWRYYGEFSTTPINSPDNVKHFSLLDHLRHLLASDPTLDELELPGGLNNWFYRNSGKVLEWVNSIRDQWEASKDVDFVHRMVMRTLQYLDGDTFVGQDLPPNAPLLVDERLGRIGLVEVNGPNQEPPSYLTHVVHHLDGLLQASGATLTLRKNIAALIAAMDNVQHWLAQTRKDAQQIMKMSDDQIRQPAMLNTINDLIDTANHAYVGQLDPSTNTTRQGAVWIHDHMQSLAVLDVAAFNAGTNHVPQQGAPDPMHMRAFTPKGA